MENNTGIVGPAIAALAVTVLVCALAYLSAAPMLMLLAYLGDISAPIAHALFDAVTWIPRTLAPLVGLG